MKRQLEAAGYEVDLQYAGDNGSLNDVPTQISQLEGMVSGGCRAIVIAAIDGSALTEVLGTAQAQGVAVIAYDRLIMSTDAVTCYVTFSNLEVGRVLGEYIRDALQLDAAADTFNIEMFASDPGSSFDPLFGGALDVLRPYIDSGVLVVPSWQTEYGQYWTEYGIAEKAQARMERLISSIGYGPDGTKLDAVLCPNDSIALGVVAALVGAGYTEGDMPIITGKDCDTPNVKYMIDGLQSMSVFKDTRVLAAQAVKMADAILKGGEPEINDTEKYDNGFKLVPTYLCAPTVCTVDNYKELLIDPGYYTEADIA